MALFGEKYGDEVRVLSMGLDEDKPYSVELCGGTHVRATGDIGLFKILSESAVAAGIRRIEAVTRDGAFSYLSGQDTLVRDIGAQFKSSPAELEGKITALMNERKKLEKELAEAKKSLALGGGGGSAAVDKEMIGNVSFIGKIFDGLDPKELRSVAEGYLAQADVVAVATNSEGKASVVVAVSKNLVSKASAVDLIKEAVVAVGGKGGGGRPEMAQGGGPDAGKLEEALTAIRAKLTSS
jgi:alanyl-tRNA synthetase